MNGKQFRFVKRITGRSCLTVPSDLREVAGLETGDFVEFEVLAIVKRAGGDDRGKHPDARGRDDRVQGDEKDIGGQRTPSDRRGIDESAPAGQAPGPGRAVQEARPKTAE